MKRKLTPIPPLCPEDLTDRETLLLHLLGEREEYIQHLINENARLISICLKNATNSKKAMISKNRLCQEFLKLKLENLQASLKNY